MMTRGRSALALAVLALQACSGGGGTPLQPATPAVSPTPPSTAPKSPAAAAVRFDIRIPAAGATPALRKPAFVPAATASIVVKVAGAAGASASATVNVGSPACTTSPGSTVCSATVQAPVGTDTFSVTTYQAANGAGNILSTGTVTQTILATSANVVPIVLNGVVAALILSIANPYLPVIDGGTTSVGVVALDAAREQIIGTYATPIMLTVPAGLTLSATSVADSAHAALSATYDGVSRTALAISAATGALTVVGKVVPTTHLHVYTAPSQVSGGSVLFPIVRGPDGAMYFGDLGPFQFFGNSGFEGSSQLGVVGRVDPITGAITQLTLNGIDPNGLFFVGNDLYIAEAVSGTVGRIVGAASGGFSLNNYSELTLPNAPPPPADQNLAGHAFPRRFAYLAGNLYVTSLMDASVDVIPLARWASGTSAVTRIVASNLRDRPDGIALASNGNFYIDSGHARLEELAPGGTTISEIQDPLLANDPVLGTRFIALGPDGKLYITATADAPAADPLESYDGTTFTALNVPAPLPAEQPDELHAGSGTTLVYTDLAAGASGVYDTAAKTFRLYPASAGQFSPGLQPNDVADGLDGSFWYTLTNYNIVSPSALPNVEIGRLVLAQGWQVLPEQPIVIDGLGATGARLLSIAEAAASGDTVSVKSTTPTVCSVSAPPGYLDTYVVVGLTTGTCSITATDQTGRTVVVPIPVSASNLTISSRRRSRGASYL